MQEKSVYEREIDLVQLVKYLWKRVWIMGIGAVVGLVLILGVQLITQGQSEESTETDELTAFEKQLKENPPITEKQIRAGMLRTGGTSWEYLGELFRGGVLEAERQSDGWEAAVIGNTMTIFANMKRAYIERSAGTMKAEKPELLDQIAAYIEKNYAQHITVSDLARQFYVSNSTISHLFKQKMGVSLYRYITQRRLIAAKSLIQRGELLEDVGRKVGFVDYSTFYRAFRQEYGISPRQFGKL